MIKKVCGVLGASLLLGLSSCSDDNPWVGEAGHGAIELSISRNSVVKDAVPVTRADGNELFKMPELTDFNIHLKKGDGATHTHLPYDDFISYSKANGFPTGPYSLIAYAGNMEDEGYEKPYFEGTTEISVLEGRTTVAEVETKLANTMVSIDYTDAFKNYMKTYSSTVHSEGHSYIDIPMGESRPVFLVPGKVGLAVSFTNPQGKELTLQPADFDAAPGCHYHITMNINNGETGVAQLEIMFDSSLEQEDVVIDLTDELFTSPAPKVTTQGFTDGETVELLTGSQSDSQYRFNVISYGGLKNVKLTLNTVEGTYKPAFGNELDLISADAGIQAQLAQAGIECKGIFRNPDRMAFVDFSNLPMMLPSGKYEVYVVATDLLGRMSEPVKITINSVAPTVTVTPKSAVYGLNQGSLLVNYNGSHPEKDLSFMAMNTDGMYVDAPILTCDESQNTRAIEGKNYLITIKLPDTGSRTKEPVEVYLNGYRVAYVELDVEVPEYTVQTDAFAKKVMIKVNASDPDMAPVIANNLKVYNGSSLVPASSISRETENGIVVVSGLNPNTTYTNYSVSLLSSTNGAKALGFKTEADDNVPNGDFSSFTQTIDQTLNVGGKYTSLTGLVQYQLTVPIRVNTPNDWGNINSLTFDMSSQNLNTWYLVPSTLEQEAGKVTVRTVGYSHNGPDIPTSRSGANPLDYRYYCQNSPEESALTKAAGQLFVGSSASGGVTFNSRPGTLSFGYTYEPMNGEFGQAIVRVYSGSTEIGTGSMLISEGSGTANVDISYINNVFGMKADRITVIFISSNAQNPSIYVPKETELNEGYNSTPANRVLQENTYHALATGSVLTVSNVKLNY